MTGRFFHHFDPRVAPSVDRLLPIADEKQRFHLMKVATAGGEPRDVSPTVWDWGEPTARVEVRTRIEGKPSFAPARTSVQDGSGHPVLPDAGQPRFDSQSGRVYLYSPGVLTVEAPAGETRIEAVRGLATPPASTSIRVGAGEQAAFEVELSPLWSGADDGWYSGDHHFHLNYGGTYRLRPESLVTVLEAEDLDVATPLMANLHTRLNDLEWFSWTPFGAPSHRLRTGGPPAFPRPHGAHRDFITALAVILGTGIPRLRAGRPPKRKRSRALPPRGGHQRLRPSGEHGNAVSGRGPAGGTTARAGPGGHGRSRRHSLEVACLWSDEVGTAEAWYRLLNVGVPIALSAGTDAFSNFYRSMAVGTTRVYVRVAGELNLSSYSMDSYPFAHTGPIWIGRVGSLDPEAARASARELLAWLDVADKRLAEGYEGSAIPTLEARFAGARRKLESLSR